MTLTFILATPSVIEQYLGANIISYDVSGPESRGHKYTLAAQVELDDLLQSGADPVSNYREVVKAPQSVEIWLSEEKNKAGKMGAIGVFYSLDEYNSGIAALKELIDGYRAKYPQLTIQHQPVQVEHSKVANTFDVKEMTKIMLKAVKDGHPAVRMSTFGRELTFNCTFPRFRANGEIWPTTNSQLAVHDPALAREQMVHAGLIHDKTS